MKKYVIYTDGGARGNPGPAAAGVVIYDDSNNITAQFASYLGHATNNQAEYQAIILGLGRIVKLVGDNHKLLDVEVSAYLDSELIVRQIKGEYKVKNQNLKPLFIKLTELIGQFGLVKFHHVMRNKNKLADQLLNEELDRHLN